MRAFRLLLTSVPHSGTNFFQRIVRPDYFFHVHEANSGISRRRWHAEHLFAAELVACVLRRPEAIWQSWWNRGRLNARDWRFAWMCFDRITRRRPDIWFLPIDTEDREARLSALAAQLARMKHKALGRVDWSEKVNASDQGRGPAPEIDMSGIYANPVIQRFYG